MRRSIIPAICAKTPHRDDLIEIGFDIAKAGAETLDVFRDRLIENIASQDRCQKRPRKSPSSRLNEGLQDQMLAFRQEQLVTLEVYLSGPVDRDIAICEVVELA